VIVIKSGNSFVV